MSLLRRSTRIGKKFQAPVPTQVGGLSVMAKVLPLYLKNRAETEPKERLGPFRTDAAVYGREPGSGLRVTWFGHSSVLVEVDGVRVLVDPVWDERASPVQWFGPKRFFAPTLPLEELPVCDAVIISHDHYDHLGAGTVRRLARLWPGVQWVTPLCGARLLRRLGVERVMELDWTEGLEVSGRDGRRVRVTAVPARHFSGRSMWNRNETLWAAFVLAGDEHRVYCGADTGWWPGLEDIARVYGPFDVTMLEVGAFHPLWADIHLGAESALRAFAEMGGAGLLMPIHWGLFNLALHGWREPIERVWAEPGVRLLAPRPGVPVEVVRGVEVREGWWQGLAK